MESQNNGETAIPRHLVGRSLPTLSLVCLSRGAQSDHTQYSTWVADGGHCRVPGRPLPSIPPNCLAGCRESLEPLGSASRLINIHSSHRHLAWGNQEPEAAQRARLGSGYKAHASWAKPVRVHCITAHSPVPRLPPVSTSVVTQCHH